MRKLSCLLVVAAALIGFAVAAQAASPSGPRLAFVRLSYPPHAESPSRDLLTTGPNREAQQLVTGTSVPGGVEPEGGVAWSPDGQTLAVAAYKELDPGDSSGVDESYDLYQVGADGTGLRQLTNLGDAAYPVFSADGATLYFARFGGFKSLRKFHTSIWAIGVDGTGLRQLTPDKGLVFDYPASVSPAGDELAFTRTKCDRKLRCGFAALGFSPATGAVRRLAKHAGEPVYSPDGSQIALVSYRDRNGWISTGEDERSPATELYVQDTATGHMRRLTRTKDIEESEPSWDPSGQRIAFGRLDSYFSSWILETNSDGSCTSLLFGKKRHHDHVVGNDFKFPIWQPGVDRAAGRIAC
jgi:TolB protein